MTRDEASPCASTRYHASLRSAGVTIASTPAVLRSLPAAIAATTLPRHAGSGAVTGRRLLRRRLLGATATVAGRRLLGRRLLGPTTVAVGRRLLGAAIVAAAV